MRIVQSLIGGLLGSAIGTGLYYALVASLKRPMPWAVVMIGILAGLGVRICCGKNRNLITGLVATATTLVALLSYNFATISAAELSAPPIAAEPEDYPEWVDEVEIGDDEINAEDSTEDADEEAPASTDEPADVEDAPANDPPADENGSDEDGIPDEGEFVSDDEVTEAARAAGPEATLDGQTLGPVLPTAPSSQTDAIALALSGLLAYVIGRGSGAPQSSQSPDSAPAA